jgi:hypothetical protein
VIVGATAQSSNLSNSIVLPLSYVGIFNAGDIVTEKVNAVFTGGTTTVSSNSPITITRLSGPAVVASSESVNMSYSLISSNTQIGTSDTIVPFNTKNFDSHNAYSTANNTWTAPISGVYSVTAKITFSVTNFFCIMNLYKNASLAIELSRNDVSNHGTAATNGSTLIKLNAGDTLSIYANAQSANNLSTYASQNYLNIYRVGN